MRTDKRLNAIDVAYDKPIAGRPFAMLRSMYVTEFNNDVARIAVREKGAKGWREDNIMRFGRATATDVWMGRTSPSQHNTSSPDTCSTASPIPPRRSGRSPNPRCCRKLARRPSNEYYQATPTIAATGVAALPASSRASPPAST